MPLVWEEDAQLRQMDVMLLSGVHILLAMFLVTIHQVFLHLCYSLMHWCIHKNMEAFLTRILSIDGNSSFLIWNRNTVSSWRRHFFSSLSRDKLHSCGRSNYFLKCCPPMYLMCLYNLYSSLYNEKKCLSCQRASCIWPSLRWLWFPSRPDGSAVWAVCVWTRGCEKRASSLVEGGLLTPWLSPLSPCSCASPSNLNF